MFTPWNKHKTLLSQGTTVRMIHGQEDDPDNEEDEPDGSNGKTRDLVAGDFFGELSLLYDCKRTCTVAATETSYGNYGLLDEASVLKLFKDYPEFEKYLKERHLRTYTDDLNWNCLHFTLWHSPSPPGLQNCFPKHGKLASLFLKFD